MKIEITDAIWLDHVPRYTLAELVDLSGLPQSVVAQLMEYGAPGFDDEAGLEAGFDADSIDLALMARRLRRDFDLDAGGLALTLTLLNRIRELEAQLRALHAQYPHSS